MDAERRVHPRHLFECPVQIRDIAGRAAHMLRISFSQNISEIGLKIVSFDFYPVEELVHMKLFSPQSVCLLEVIGTIVWVQQYPYQHKYGLGLRFASLGDAGRTKLTQLIQAGPNGAYPSPMEYQ